MSTLVTQWLVTEFLMAEISRFIKFRADISFNKLFSILKSIYVWQNAFVIHVLVGEKGGTDRNCAMSTWQFESWNGIKQKRR